MVQEMIDIRIILFNNRRTQTTGWICQLFECPLKIKYTKSAKQLIHTWIGRVFLKQTWKKGSWILLRMGFGLPAQSGDKCHHFNIPLLVCQLFLMPIVQLVNTSIFRVISSVLRNLCWIPVCQPTIFALSTAHQFVLWAIHKPCEHGRGEAGGSANVHITA